MNIIDSLHHKNWSAVKKFIQNGKIDWNMLIDQTNGALHYLAYQNQTDLLKLIDADSLPELVTQANTEGDTICHIAAKLNNSDLFYFIININPKVIYYLNILGKSPLYYLTTEYELIKNIVKKFNLRDHIIDSEFTFLEYYIVNKHLPLILFLLDHITPNTLSNILICSTVQSTYNTHDKQKLVEKLIKLGVDINSLDREFLSPLILAIQQKDYGMTKFLLDHGANPNYFGPENNNHPLTIAITNGDTKIIKLLLKSQIDLDATDKFLQTPLHHLFISNISLPTDLKKKLVDKMENINAADNQMNSVLNLLVQNDNWKSYKDVLERKKLKIYLKNKDNTAPIDLIKNKDVDSFYQTVYQSYLNQLKINTIARGIWVDPIDNKIAYTLENGGSIDPYKNYLFRKIIGGQSYPIIKTKQKPIKLIAIPKTNITHFAAYTYNYICFLYYILKKYPTIKIPSLAPGQMADRTLNQLYEEMIEDYQENTPDNAIFRSIIRDYINHSPILINHLIIWKNNEMYFFSPYIVQGIHETLVTYPDTEFIILKLTIINDQNFNHANVLIFDIKNNIAERFDPYGKVPFVGNDEINEVFRVFFSEYFPHITYVPPEGISYQIFSDEGNNQNYVENDPVGFCIAWCLWYIEMRIKNKNINPQILIKKTTYQINKSEDRFKDYIRNYSNYLDMEKNKTLRGANVPKNYWYKHYFPLPMYQSYLQYIRRIYDAIN